MKFEVLSEVEFDNFASNHEQASFMQTSMMAKMRENYGWKKHYLGIIKDNKIIAAGLFLSSCPIGITLPSTVNMKRKISYPYLLGLFSPFTSTHITGPFWLLFAAGPSLNANILPILSI